MGLNEDLGDRENVGSAAAATQRAREARRDEVTIRMTAAQHTALVGLLMEYVSNATHGKSGLTVEFVDCSQSPPVTTTPWELLNIVSNPVPVSGLTGFDGRKDFQK